MKKKETISDFSLSELTIIKNESLQYASLEDFQKSLTQRIEEGIKKEEDIRKNPNIYFNRDLFVKLQIFDPWELEILDFYHIQNLQELIDFDMSQLVDVPISIREKLEWARSFYDLRSMVSDHQKSLIKKGDNSDGNKK